MLTEAANNLHPRHEERRKSREDWEQIMTRGSELLTTSHTLRVTQPKGPNLALMQFNTASVIDDIKPTFKGTIWLEALVKCKEFLCLLCPI